MNNPLFHAIAARDHAMETETDMMFEVAGDAAFDPFDEVLCEAIANLVCNSAEAVASLLPRARQARLNLIWKDFVKEQRSLRAV